MGSSPGGGGIGLECTDLRAEHARLVARGDVDVDADLMQTPGTPLMFMLRDPDGNHIVLVEAGGSAPS
jgi:predicted enzyme related to lactoylglutathione lyase